MNLPAFDLIVLTWFDCAPADVKLEPGNEWLSAVAALNIDCLESKLGIYWLLVTDGFPNQW